MMQVMLFCKCGCEKAFIVLWKMRVYIYIYIYIKDWNNLITLPFVIDRKCIAPLRMVGVVGLCTRVGQEAVVSGV